MQKKRLIPIPLPGLARMGLGNWASIVTIVVIVYAILCLIVLAVFGIIMLFSIEVVVPEWIKVILVAGFALFPFQLIWILFLVFRFFREQLSSK